MSDGDCLSQDDVSRYRRSEARPGTAERGAANVGVRVAGRPFCRRELLHAAVRQARMDAGEGPCVCQRARSRS